MSSIDQLRRAKLQRTRAQVVDTIVIGTPHEDASRHKLAVRRIREALTFIKAHDPERYRFVCRAIDVIWVFPMKGNMASLAIEDGAFICRISYEVVLWSAVELVASVIVHEAAHARLIHIGVQFAAPPVLCEAYCVLQQRLFARRTGRAEGIEAILDGYVEDWPEMIAFQNDRLVTDDWMEVAFYRGLPVGVLYFAYDVEVWWTEMVAPALQKAWGWIKRLCRPEREKEHLMPLLGPPARDSTRVDPDPEALVLIRLNGQFTASPVPVCLAIQSDAPIDTLRGFQVMATDRWLTTAESADLLGLTVGSLRNRARSECWPKGTDSQGTTTFLVPADAAAKGQRRRSGGVKESGQVELSPDLVLLQRRVAELEADLATARQERDQARIHARQEGERADRLAGEQTDVVQQQADMAALRREADAERGRAETLEAQITALRARRDDRISLLERLIVWHRKSWLRKLFEEPPEVWLPGDHAPSR